MVVLSTLTASALCLTLALRASRKTKEALLESYGGVRQPNDRIKHRFVGILDSDNEVGERYGVAHPLPASFSPPRLNVRRRAFTPHVPDSLVDEEEWVEVLASRYVRETTRCAESTIIAATRPVISLPRAVLGLRLSSSSRTMSPAICHRDLHHRAADEAN